MEHMGNYRLVPPLSAGRGKAVTVSLAGDLSERASAR